MRIAINGMGRIGRLLFRRLLHHPEIEIVAVNDIMPMDNLAYLLKYDSIYGTFRASFHSEDGSLVAGEKKIAVFQKDHPSQLEWNKLYVDVVLECSVKISKLAGANEHLKRSAKKFLL